MKNIDNIYRSALYNHRVHENDLWTQISNKLDSQKKNKELVETSTFAGKLFKVSLPIILITGSIVSAVLLYNRSNIQINQNSATLMPVISENMKEKQKTDFTYKQNNIQTIQKNEASPSKVVKSQRINDITSRKNDGSIDTIINTIAFNTIVDDVMMEIESVDTKVEKLITLESNEKPRKKVFLKTFPSRNIIDKALFSENQFQVYKIADYSVRDSFYCNWKKHLRKESIKWYIGFNIKPNYLISSVSETDNRVEKIADIKGDRWSYNCGLILGFSSKKVILETGVNYSINESILVDEFGWSTRNTIIEVIQDSISFTINVSDSNSRTRYGDVLDTNEYLVNYDYLAKSHYKVVEIPVLIGYKLEMNKSSIILKLGIIASYNMVRHENVVPVDENHPYLENVHKTNNINWGVVLSPEYDYTLSKRVHFKIGPHVKYSSGSFYQDNYPANRKLHYTGVNVGFNYWF